MWNISFTSIEIQYGGWKNNGSCVALHNNKSCGPGHQAQIQNCIDGTFAKCTVEDREQSIPCELPDCSRIVGEWMITVTCETSGEGKSCGPGLHTLTRTCMDGTADKCTSVETTRTVSCKDICGRLQC